jgi:NAD dependent epimerase/dehydratase family enzyme
MPWIQIEDLCQVYIKAIEDNKLSGAYNAVSPMHITQKEFIINLTRAMNKKSISLPVPSLLLKMFLGEMSSIVLKGSRITPQKLINSGFSFRFSDIAEALNSVLR